MILSGERLGMIDPHEKYFNAATFGWNFRHQPELLDSLSGHLRPFHGKFGYSNSELIQSSYPATIFRFPLRRKPSPLSTSVYNNEKVSALFDTFQQNGHLLLLFMMHLELIELYEQDERQNEPHLKFQIKLTDDCIDDVRKKRVNFLNKARCEGWLAKPVTCSYRISIQTISWTKKSKRSDSFSYLVTNYYCGGNVSASFKQLFDDPDLRYPPWVGVALAIDKNKQQDNKTNEKAETEKGLSFCFLPIEELMSTGLPVHVNGFFALEQNRKQIKWPSSFLHQSFLDKRVNWNQCLLKEALPKAYSSLILKAIQLCQSGDVFTPSDIYQAFPDINQVDCRWQTILMPTYVEVLKNPVIYTKNNGGRWLLNKEAIYNTLDIDAPSIVAILDVLSKASCNIASIPTYVLDAIRSCCPFNLIKITPHLVANSFSTIQYNSSFSKEHKMLILKYFLQQKKYDLLEGLELLPTANGTMQCFVTNPRRAKMFIYISSQNHSMELFPGMEEHFLDNHLEYDILPLLTTASQRGKFVPRWYYCI